MPLMWKSHRRYSASQRHRKISLKIFEKIAKKREKGAGFENQKRFLVRIRLDDFAQQWSMIQKSKSIQKKVINLFIIKSNIIFLTTY